MNPGLLHLLTRSGYVPVVACVAGDRQGRVYNVNADQMAVACAAAFGAGMLLFLTDVQGVMSAEREVIPELTTSECDALIAQGIATGGMQAKLNAASEAVRQGVGRVLIAPGAVSGVIRQALDNQPVGTSLVLGAVQGV